MPQIPGREDQAWFTKRGKSFPEKRGCDLQARSQKITGVDALGIEDSITCNYDITSRLSYML